MNILITGNQGLAKALGEILTVEHSVTYVSRSTGHDINCVADWGVDFLDYDSVYNCAYDGLGQQQVLEYFYHHWQLHANKQIVTIGSKVITQPRIDIVQDKNYWPYRAHKQTLQAIFDSMVTTACCDMKIINPGAMDTPLIANQNVIKMPVDYVAKRIVDFINDPINKRLDLWV
jgi:hypothetical protein